MVGYFSVRRQKRRRKEKTIRGVIGSVGQTITKTKGWNFATGQHAAF
jgi:hypothetical protein